MAENKFKIVVGSGPHDTTVELNGEPLNHVRRISVDIDASKRELNFLTLEIYGYALIEGKYEERLISASETIEGQIKKAASRGKSGQDDAAA